MCLAVKRLAPLTLLGAVLLAGPAAGQSLEPTPEQAPGALQTFRLTGLRGYLEFLAQQRRQEQKSKAGRGDTEWTETIFQENLHLETEGYIYHPKLMEFTLGGLFGLLQHDFDFRFGDESGGGSDSGPVFEFDFAANFLKQKKYPGNVYARREQSLEPRTFQTSVETNSESYGVLWQYLDEKTPTRLQVDYTNVEFRPFVTESENSRREHLNARFDTKYKFNEYNVLSLLYERQEVDELTAVSSGDIEPFILEYDSDELTLAHRWEFGPKQRHRLLSELNFFDQRGSLKTERIRWRETLRLQHTESLRSWFDFEALDQSRGNLLGLTPLEERSARVTGTLEHRLYESLVSRVIGFGQIQDFKQSAEIRRFGGELRFDYQKRNPLGTLRMNYRVRGEREDRRGNQLQAEVRDEPQTFRDPEVVTLSNARIDVSSIVITDLTGITFYQSIRDYRVRAFGDRIELERVPTGRIADGQTVLIDYVFDLGGDYALDTVNQDFGIRHDFDFGLSPYYRLQWQDQSVSPLTATGVIPEDITAHILGVDFRRGRLDLGAEFEDHFSTINSFDAVRLRAGYSYAFKFGGVASLRANWSDVSYDPPRDRKTRFLTLEGRYRQTIQPNFTAEIAARYRDGKDSITGPQEGVDLSFSLEWIVRQLEFRITGELKAFEDNFAENDSSIIMFQMRRRF